MSAPHRPAGAEAEAQLSATGGKGAGRESMSRAGAEMNRRAEVNRAADAHDSQGRDNRRPRQNMTERVASADASQPAATGH